MTSLTTCIFTDEALSALIEFLINPLVMKPSYFSSNSRDDDQISNQMEAVAWIYNHYLIQELPNLATLDWTALCNKAVITQPRLMKYMGLTKKGPSDLTLTEKKVKDACEKTKALQNSCNASDRFPITKVCVCLLNVRKEKCVLVSGASMLGVWSFIEKSSHADLSRKSSIDLEELAILAVQEHTGIKSKVLQVEDCFLIDECIGQGGGSTKFFIMSCFGTFDLSPTIKLKQVAWVPVDTALSSADGPLVEKTYLGVKTTSSFEYLCLRPFRSSIQKWFERQNKTEKESHKLDNETKDLQSAHKNLSMVDADKSNAQPQTAPLISVSDSALLPLEPTPHQNLEMREQKAIEAAGVRAEALKEPKEEDLFAGLKVEAPKEPKDEGFCAGLKAEAIKESKDEKSVCTLNSTEFHDKASLSQQRTYTGDSNLALCGPIPSPESSIQMTGKYEGHVLNDAAAFSIQKAAFKILKRRRKAYSKELIEVISDYQSRANQLNCKITECDSNLTLLLGGGKAASQLALQLCMNNCQKETMTSGATSVDREEKILTDVPILLTDEGETSAKKRRLSKDAFRMPSSMQELNEICITNSWPLPSYEVLTVQSYQNQNLYHGKVRIRSTNLEISETGQPSDTVKAAKQSAAASMLSTLYNIKARSSLL